MVIRIKYLGSGETGLTTNAEYVVLSVLNNTGPTAYGLIVNDAGNLYVTNEQITNTAKWEFVSASYPSCTEIS